jgi:pimeloyl-ACP methyl ester carboxylesterase
MKRRAVVRLILILFIVLLIVPFVIPLPVTGADPALFADSDGRFVTVNGLETYVREQGDPNAPAVLLLHGWGGSTFSWRETITPLAEAGYRVIAFDRPPYGLSQKSGDVPLSVTRQAQFTNALMDQLGIERAHFVGHSMGGAVIAYFSAMYPNRIASCVFVAAAVRAADEGRGESSSLVQSLLDFPPVRWWARMGLRAFVRPDAFAGLQRTAYYDQSVMTPEVVAGYGRQLEVENWDDAILDVLTRSAADDIPLSAAQIESITMPSLIVWGENDTWVEPSVGVRLREMLPNDLYITYPQVGHMPMEEVPEQFNADVIAFLDAQTNSVDDES